MWVGVSIEDQRWAQIRISALMDPPAAIRWVFCVPLLGQLFHRLDGIDWVVAGGETGVVARAITSTGLGACAIAAAPPARPPTSNNGATSHPTTR